eukprot:m.340755 g.340755  ORF g.340755 m.340755 type:complete len:488 (+) comp19502_c0_seq1:255-1718(+)
MESLANLQEYLISPEDSKEMTAVEANNEQHKEHKQHKQHVHKEKKYWRPHWFILATVTTLLHQTSWAAGYTAAQIYYTALAVEIGFTNFVTVDAQDALDDTVPRDQIRRAFFISMGFNIAFAIATYLLVLFQLGVNKRYEKGAPISVFIVKWVDNVADGASFFSTCLTYSSMLSAFEFHDGVYILPELLLFSLAIVLFSVLFTVLFEGMPTAWYYPKPPPQTAITTNKLVDDWFLGQWQWLIGFAWWTTLLSLFGSEFLDIYDSKIAWWMLCTFIFCCYILYTTSCCCVRIAQDDTDGDEKKSCCPGRFTWIDRKRIITMLHKGVSWMLGVGLYFTLKHTFPIMVRALNQENVNPEHIITFGFVVTVICYVLLVLVFIGKEAYSSNIVMSSIQDMLKLTLCYVTGKAWESMTFGLGARAATSHQYSLIAFSWQGIAGGAAIVFTIWELKTQKDHGSNHSDKCVCPVCAPEFYDEDDVEYVLEDDESL